MVTIEVLGHGCDNCKRLEQNAREAIGLAGIEAQVVKVQDDREISARGVLKTPGLVIDGRVMSTGRVPSAGDIAVWLDSAGATPSA
jgi:small redox-active disulfide protein 2